MSLPETLYSALATAIANDPALAELAANYRDDIIAEAFNVPSNPAFIVSRTSLSRHEILTGTSRANTTFAWAAGAYITRSQGERDAFREMFNDSGTVNPGLASIKSAFADIFSGAGGAGNRAHIDSLSKRVATRAERLYATGVGSEVVPGTLVFEGDISSNDISAVLSPTRG